MAWLLLAVPLLFAGAVLAGRRDRWALLPIATVGAAATLATGICHSGDSPAEASSTASAVAAGTTGSASSSNSTGSSANGTTSSSPKASGADFEGAAASGFGMSLAAIALGGVAFMI